MRKRSKVSIIIFIITGLIMFDSGNWPRGNGFFIFAGKGVDSQLQSPALPFGRISLGNRIIFNEVESILARSISAYQVNLPETSIIESISVFVKTGRGNICLGK
jgi:hypothetical protein